jgi:hypothetical protein
MGLDMYAFAISKEVAGDKEVDIKIEEETVRNDLWTWRKHHDLHGWMHRLYDEKGGVGEDFNCDNLALNLDDLDSLEKAIKENTLPHTQGFFFGNNPPDAETMSEDLEFVELARGAIADGKAVIYSSWW